MNDGGRRARRLGEKLGIAGCVLVAGLAAACSGKGGDAAPSDGGPAGVCTTPRAGFDLPTAVAKYPTLSSLCLFDVARSGATARLTPRAGLVPYDLNTPLFSDYTWKSRWILLPAGTKATYRPDTVFDFPVGTLIVKTFGFAADLRRPTDDVKLVETRVMVRSADGWIGLPYVWSDDQADAALTVGGAVKSASWVGVDGAPQSTDHYLVPSTAQCAQCHADDAHVFQPIGPKARNLNRALVYPDGASDNQLAHWTRLGLLDGAPADPASAPRLPTWNDPATGSLDERARAWLEVNCAHCHDPHGTARTTGLFLDTAVTDLGQRGLCKPPVAAGPGSGGRAWDISPGKPDDSILIFRVESTAPALMMPALGRSVVHAEGVALLREWIAAMPTTACTAK